MDYKLVQLNADDPRLALKVAGLVKNSQLDSLILSDSVDSLVESLTYLPVFINNGCHFHPIYGRYLQSLEDICYQLSRTFPREYPIKTDMHALYDLVLGLETEPAQRIVLWHDAQMFFHFDRSSFLEIAELLLTASLLNRSGSATIKDNGDPYMVNQSCVFGFQYPTERFAEMADEFLALYQGIQRHQQGNAILQRLASQIQLQIILIE